jgi:hypothetical protein
MMSEGYSHLVEALSVITVHLGKRLNLIQEQAAESILVSAAINYAATARSFIHYPASELNAPFESDRSTLSSTTQRNYMCERCRKPRRLTIFESSNGVPAVAEVERIAKADLGEDTPSITTSLTRPFGYGPPCRVEPNAAAT